MAATERGEAARKGKARMGTTVTVTCPTCKGHVNLRTNECACDVADRMPHNRFHEPGDLEGECPSRWRDSGACPGHPDQ